MEENATPKNTTTSQTDENEQVKKLQSQLADFERVKNSLEKVLTHIDKFENMLLNKGRFK